MANSASFSHSTKIAAPAARVFRWHEHRSALKRLIPPWESIELIKTLGAPPEVGSEVLLRVHLGPFSKEWRARHIECSPPFCFTDTQVSGPFSSWQHKHSFIASAENETLLTDEVKYSLPLHSLTFPLVGSWIDRKLRRMFLYRQEIIRTDLETHATLNLPPQRFLIAGSSGMIGNSLVTFLEAGGHSVVRLLRNEVGETNGEAIYWDPYSAQAINPSLLEDIDIVIHLGGSGIADKRWTVARKEELRRSRIESTKNLVSAIERCRRGPKTFVCASAIGIYGSQADKELNESTPAAADFLGNLGRDWESATLPLAGKGVRVVNLRFGIVLSPSGGALAKMLPIFRSGLGAPLGTGEQYLSWCSLHDAVRAVAFCCAKTNIHGPVNICTPNPVTNREFSTILARVCNRPLFPAIPKFALRVLLGEMADHALLSSSRCFPQQLDRHGFKWNHPQLEEALRFVLGVCKK